ncbi:hypothetical protein [Sphingomonas yabuuchiae]|nr:hypothetical protein [Sphingomonas yabuuchiae]
MFGDFIVHGVLEYVSRREHVETRFSALTDEQKNVDRLLGRSTGMA